VSRDRRTETPLSHVIDEIRREPSPSIDWEAMEESLMAEVGRTTVSRPVRITTAFSPKWALALAACVFGAGGLMLMRGPAVPVAPVATTHVEQTAPAVTGKVDGDALDFGAHVNADAADVTVEHAGHVTWTLEKGSSAHLESVGEVVALSLDRGAVGARVVKSLRPETFVVRVDRTRIAVHGTEFRVERLASGVRVRVTEGVLGIGPLTGPAFELRAPGSAMLNLDGARTDLPKIGASSPRHASPTPEAPRAAEEPAAVAAEAAPVAAESASAPVAVAPKALPKSAPPPPGTEPLVSQTARAVQRCFATHTLAGGDLHVSVMTKMALRVTTDGRVGDALFDPPLAPSVRDCVDREVGALRFPSSEAGFEAGRSLELSR